MKKLLSIMLALLMIAHSIPSASFVYAELVESQAVETQSEPETVEYSEIKESTITEETEVIDETDEQRETDDIVDNDEQEVILEEAESENIEENNSDDLTDLAENENTSNSEIIEDTEDYDDSQDQHQSQELKDIVDNQDVAEFTGESSLIEEQLQENNEEEAVDNLETSVTEDPLLGSDISDDEDEEAEEDQQPENELLVTDPTNEVELNEIQETISEGTKENEKSEIENPVEIIDNQPSSGGGIIQENNKVIESVDKGTQNKEIVEVKPEYKVEKQYEEIDIVEEYGLDNIKYFTDEGISIKSNELIDMYLPLVLNGYEIYDIADSALRGYTFLRTIIVPSQITSIGDNAFADCKNLSLIIFEGRSNLDDLELGENWSGGTQVVFGIQEIEVKIQITDNEEQDKDEKLENVEISDTENELVNETNKAVEKSDDLDGQAEKDEIYEESGIEDTLANQDKTSDTEVEPETETGQAQEPEPEPEPEPPLSDSSNELWDLPKEDSNEPSIEESLAESKNKEQSEDVDYSNDEEDVEVTETIG